MEEEKYIPYKSIYTSVYKDGIPINYPKITWYTLDGVPINDQKITWYTLDGVPINNQKEEEAQYASRKNV
ncbi:MAG: hypothetical protein PHH31_09215 [Acidaminococcaceae bacterium]|nr:hypothetical protein [Acidaminococcaceae bacterium]